MSDCQLLRLNASVRLDHNEPMARDWTSAGATSRRPSEPPEELATASAHITSMSNLMTRRATRRPVPGSGYSAPWPAARAILREIQRVKLKKTRAEVDTVLLPPALSYSA